MCYCEKQLRVTNDIQQSSLSTKLQFENKQQNNYGVYTNTTGHTTL